MMQALPKSSMLLGWPLGFWDFLKEPPVCSILLPASLR